MKAPIRLIDLTTGYKGKPVTENINAELKAGELTCLLGPNGAGKSTLLKTLSTFIPPLSGEILINGENARKMGARKLARILGVVLTERPAGMNMTVEELVAIGRSPYTSFMGGLKDNDREIVERAIQLVGIENLRKRNISTLSDGERQKALIAKALAQQTDIIFLDEPTAFLDYPSKVGIMKLLYNLARQEGKTFFMSTHDVELALQIADKIWLLDKEKGLKIGIPEDLAMKGYLAEYFESGGLVYNRSKAAFEIEHPINSQIRLKGEGELADMTCRALHRVGIQTVRDSEEPFIDICIEKNSDGKDAIYFRGEEIAEIGTLLEKLSR